MVSRLEDNKVAFRYAKALFEKADAENQCEKTMQDLRSLQSLFNEAPDLMPFFTNPGILSTEKIEFIDQQLAGDDLSPWSINLLKLLAENDRMTALMALVARFEEMINRKNNIANAEVITATDLDASLEEKLKDILKNRFGFQEITLDKRVDPSILGGAIVKIEDRIIDGSYVRRLEALKQA